MTDIGMRFSHTKFALQAGGPGEEVVSKSVGMSDEPNFHLRLCRGDVGRYVLLPGDPGRVPLLAGHLENASEVARNREFVTHTGTLEGVTVSVTSTGIGAPSTAIVVEELVELGADTFVRVGTAGSIQKNLSTGDLVVATAAVRNEGTTRHYVPEIFPAVASPDVVEALCAAAAGSKRQAYRGIVVSSDAFYADVAPTTMPRLVHPTDIWRRAGVLVSEMEASALFVVAHLRVARAGAILAVVNVAEAGPIETAQVTSLSMEPLIQTAIAGVRRLIQKDSAI